MPLQPATSDLGLGPGPSADRSTRSARTGPATLRVRRARVLALLVVVGCLLLVFPGLARGDGPDRPAARVTYVVRPGDTLWAIAQRTAPARDPREVVYQLVRDNHLHGQLQPGQRLSLPASGR
jgi:Tfp pilus assembly protein FimV